MAWQVVAQGRMDEWQAVVSGAQQFFSHGDLAQFRIHLPDWVPVVALTAMASAIRTVLVDSGITPLGDVRAEGTDLVFEVREQSPVILGIALAPIPAALLQAAIAIGLVGLIAIVAMLTFTVLKWTVFTTGIIGGIEGSGDWIVIGALMVLGLLLIRR